MSGASYGCTLTKNFGGIVKHLLKTFSAFVQLVTALFSLAYAQYLGLTNINTAAVNSIVNTQLLSVQVPDHLKFTAIALEMC